MFDSVPREQYELLQGQLEVAIADRRSLEERYAALVSQVVDIKRHELGMQPQNYVPPEDPFDKLPKTRMAIDLFANGDVELIRYLEGRALLKASSVLDEAERDSTTAKYIELGDA